MTIECTVFSVRPTDGTAPRQGTDVSEHSLVIRNGTVVDGTGMPGYRADVAVSDGRITAIGTVPGSGARELDAEGHVVTPGFVDGHTHMDAQVFWDPLGTSSCWHGVTTVVMGNCGFTLAPSREGERALVIDNLERAEDIPAEALAEGVKFEWETFREYLDVLDRVPKGINYAAQIGHSAVRTWAMGARAFEERASEDDLAAMEREVVDACTAGAVGFTTSRSEHHVTPAGDPVASRVAEWDEVVALVSTMARSGGGVFELANESVMTSADADARGEAMARLHDLAVKTGVLTTFGITTYGDPNRWRELLRLLDRAADSGGRMYGQSTCKESGAIFSFLTWLPFDKLAAWQEVRRLPLDEQAAALRRPEVRESLAAAVRGGTFSLAKEVHTRPLFERILVLERAAGPNPSVATVAAERVMDPVETMIDLALERDLDRFFFQVTGNDEPRDVETILRSPRTVMTFSDSGAHVSQIINSSLQTHLLSHWVREREVFTLEEAVRMLTLVPSTVWSLGDRGLVREGFVADLNVFDPARVAPAMPEVVHDLPAGATRLTQRAEGFLATVVAGEVVLRDGEHEGALPGRLVRRGARG